MKIVLADDHQMVLDGLQRCFASDPDFEVLGTATDGEELLELVVRTRPDLALVDITMPGLNGLEAVRAITRRSGTGTRCVVLSMHREKEFVNAAFRNGASGYLLKSASFTDLKDALRAVMRGEKYVGERVADVIMGPEPLGEQELPPLLSRLTPRERQTLQLLAEGLTVKQIGEKLGISHKTVHTFRASLMQKLDCKTVAELTRVALRMGLTNLD